MLLQEVLAFSPMLKAEPVRRLLRLGKAPTGVLAAAVVLANVVLDASRRSVFGPWKSDFVAHSGLMGPTRPEWSLGCLLIVAALTSRSTRLN